MPCFDKVFENHAADTAVICDKKNLTYRQLNQSIHATQQRLKTAGLKPNDRFAVISQNSLEYIIILLAAWRIKAVACLLNTRIPPRTITQQLLELNCSLLIVSDKFVQDIPQSKAKKILVSEIVTKKDSDSPPEESNVSLEQDATIMFTSGSFRTPKAVMHTLGNHYYSAKGSNENIPVGPSDRWLLSLPLYHVSGLSIVFRILLNGGTIVIPPENESLTISIRNSAVTHVSLVTTQLVRLLKDADNIQILKKMKTILLGGSALPENLIKAAEKHQLPLYTTYGLTEMASQVATANPKSGPPAGEAGKTKILNYRQVKISPDHEILVKGETLFRGYWENDKVTIPLRKDGWFATGDLGNIDPHGYLTVTGRRDNMFICGGENIQPEEIEQQLLNIQKVEQAIVIPVKDSEFGFRPAAFVKIHNGTKIPEEEITRYLKEKIPSFKIPRQFHPWPKEQTPGIKIARQYFKELL